ncbi:efflux RND transporter permease subunit [Shimazuella kribbensis]|uniref:efflux RND transporter permease subunit n=1 Tax=Shimazuella kribbensis TaxID=139808 RepID=UPI000418E07B|nr:efflux RND transporter permease subunit [Shimazuella kribbensis]
MTWLTRFSLKNVAAVLILVFLVAGGGIYTAYQLKMEAMPDISFPVVVALTPYPGASPEDIDKKVTQPIEKSVRGLKGIDKISSVTADSTSVVVIQYDFDTDLDKAQQEIKDAVSKVSLPEQAMETTFNRFGFNTISFLNLAITSDTKNSADLERWVNNDLKSTLTSINGVGEITVKGQGPKAVYIKLKPEKLKKYNLSLQQVQQTLQGANLSLPVGDFTQDQIDKPVRVEQNIQTIEDLKNYKLTVPSNPSAGLEDAFNQIGEGFQGLGQAVGGLGQAVGGLGQGLGQVGQGVGLLQAQVQILQAAQQIQAQIIGDQLSLNQVMAKMQQNPDKPEYKGQVQGLQQKIKAEQGVLRQLNGQLKSLQAKLPKQKAGSPSSKVKLPKSSGVSKPKVEEQKIETVRLSDIATITESGEDNEMITRTNGKPSVNLEIVKDPDANVVELADDINAKLVEIQKENKDIRVQTLYDQSIQVKESVYSMIREGTLGALFAAFIILIFLRNFRMTLISIVSIPISVFITLIVLQQANITLNIMTLGGLAVAIGRVVDDSIVVIENIYRHLKKYPERNTKLIRTATGEVASAITSSTLTTVAVFLPLGLVSGVVGEIFMPFAITVSVALLSSLLVAVTVVPVLAKLFLLRGKRIKTEEKPSKIAEAYKRALRWSLDHKWVVWSVSLALLVASLFLVPLIGTSFLPADKDKVMSVSLKMPSGTTLEKTNQVADQMEAKIKSNKEVEVISTSVGNLKGQLSASGSVGSSNQASFFISLQSTADVDKVLSHVRAQLEPLQKDGEIKVEQVSSTGPPSSSQLQVTVKGDKLEDIRVAAEKITAEMKKMKGLTNVTNNLSDQKDVITVHVDPQKAAANGLQVNQVASTVRGLLTADNIMTFDQGDQTQEVKLGLVQTNAKSIQELQKIEFINSLGKTIKLGTIAAIKQEKTPVTIQKEDLEEYATITGDSVVKDTGALSKTLQIQVNKIALPSGVTASIGGAADEMTKSFSQLGIAMLIAIAAVYIVMIITFGQATAPFTILFSLPFAVIGGLVGLYLSKQPISVSSMIGALMLIGIVVTNAIVLIDRVQQQRRRGLDVKEALIEAGGTRLRPILMTALATICALLPLGLGFGQGTLISQGLAVVVIGGLTSSTLLTLFIVPIIYSSFSRFQRHVSLSKEDE